MRKVQLFLQTGQEHDELIVENSEGLVSNQDVWEGKPYKLVGFVKNKIWKVIDIDHQTFYDKPHMAVGKYPIFADNENEWYIAESIVKDVAINDGL
jgi:hypothetical protein